MKETKVCNICNKKKTLLKSSWYSNDECSACRAKARYKNSGRREYKKKWREQNKEHHLKYCREYKAKRIKEDPNFKIKNALRKRISEAIKNDHKASSAVKELGCSIEKAREHLESQFTEGMTWDNYGEWHIDHIQPLANFDLTDVEQFKKVCNYKNLQPLWADDNFKKSDKDEF